MEKTTKDSQNGTNGSGSRKDQRVGTKEWQDPNGIRVCKSQVIRRMFCILCLLCIILCLPVVVTAHTSERRHVVQCQRCHIDECERCYIVQWQRRHIAQNGRCYVDERPNEVQTNKNDVQNDDEMSQNQIDDGKSLLDPMVVQTQINENIDDPKSFPPKGNTGNMEMIQSDLLWVMNKSIFVVPDSQTKRVEIKNYHNESNY